MKAYYDAYIDPELEFLRDMLEEDWHNVPNTYLTFRNGKRVRHISVHEVPGEHVAWSINGNKMTKTFDYSEVPF